MHLEIFVYLLCRFLGENRIYTIQRENTFTSRALPRNWPFGLVIENRSCKGRHGDRFPQADSGCYSAVRQGKGWYVNNSRVKIVRLYTPDVLRSAEVVR
jgi:hypothetical protein